LVVGATGRTHRSLLGWLFVPATAVMNRLTFARKFLLVGLLLSGPLAFVVHLQAGSAGERVEFHRRERQGVACLVPVFDLLHGVLLHRLHVWFAVEGPSVRETRAAARSAIARVDAVEKESGALLGVSEEWRSIKTAWRDLLERPTASREARDLAHEAVADRLVERLLRRVGDTSNLILDPHLDSYWLMDAALVKLPSLAVTASRASAASLRLGVGSSPAGLEPACELASGARRELAAIRELREVDLATAFRETARHAGGSGSTLEKRLAAALDGAEAAVGRHAELLRRQALDPRAGATTGAEVIELAGELFGRLRALETSIAPELDRLIEARLERYRDRRVQGLLAAATAALVVIYLLVGIYLSVQRSVSALLRPPGSASPPGTLPTARDEMGQIAVAYSRAQDEKSQLEEQLRVAEKLATIGTLAAGTAHELNEPLGAVLGFAELAGKTPGLPASAARDLRKISGAALHAREVIKKLLLFARQTPPQTRPTDLQQVIREALDFLQARFDLASIALVRELDEVPPVLADASQLRQVVLNLVVNALQASRDGGEVTVRLLNEAGHAVLEVADRGAGMSPEVCEQAFIPFFTTKDVGEGTGLGLSVVHGIVEAHGGRIEVRSQVGEGTTVTVRLPLSSYNHV
jgi:signal transduction histidine kinase